MGHRCRIGYGREARLRIGPRQVHQVVEHISQPRTARGVFDGLVDDRPVALRDMGLDGRVDLLSKPFARHFRRDPGQHRERRVVHRRGGGGRGEKHGFARRGGVKRGGSLVGEHEVRGQQRGLPAVIRGNEGEPGGEVRP